MTDYGDTIETWQKVKEHQLKKHKCTGCRFYRLQDNPSKGGAKGVCEKRIGKYPDHQRWWGTAMNDVCEHWEERK